MSGDEGEGDNRRPDSQGSHPVEAFQRLCSPSPEWFELAVKILAEVAQECGEDGFQLSVCEVFINPPREFADEDGRMSWCFTSTARARDAREGIRKTLMSIWKELGPCRRSANPNLEYLEEQAENLTSEDPNLLIEGDMERLPALDD